MDPTKLITVNRYFTNNIQIVDNIDVINDENEKKYIYSFIFFVIVIYSIINFI